MQKTAGGKMEETNKKEEYLKERYTLAMERIHGIIQEETVPAPFCVYFKKISEFLIQVEELWTKLRVGEMKNYTLEQWQELNHKMYEDILPGALRCKLRQSGLCGG